MTFTKNIYLLLQRPSSRPEPAWALLVLAENLYRGRDRSRPAGHQNHHMLPQLLTAVGKRPGEEVNRRLLLGAMGQFLAALECLSPYLFETRTVSPPLGPDENMESTQYGEANSPEFRTLRLHPASGTEIQQMIQCGEAVVDWLRVDDAVRMAKGVPDELLKLSTALDLSKPFCITFDQMFHETVENLEAQMRKHLDGFQGGGATLDFKYVPQSSARGCRVLTHVHELVFFLANWTIEPVGEQPRGSFRSRIEVHREVMAGRPPSLRFRLLTHFADVPTTNQLTMNSPHYSTDATLLHTFGISPQEWEEPTQSEKENGFTSANNLIVPAGYLNQPPEP